MLAAVAPVAPVAIEAAIALTLVLTCLVSLGFLWVWRATLKQLLYIAADTFDRAAINVGFKTIHFLGPVSSFLRFVAERVDYLLASAVHATEGGIVFFWNLLAAQVNALAAFVGDLTETVEHALERTTTVTIPQTITNVTKTTIQRIGITRAYADRIVTRAVATVTHEVGVLRGDLTAARDALGALRHRVAKLEHGALVAAAAGTAAFALARLGLGWIRCRNVSKVGRRVCGMDPLELEALLAGSVVLFATLDIRTFAREMQDVTEEVSGLVREFWHAG